MAFSYAVERGLTLLGLGEQLVVVVLARPRAPSAGCPLLAGRRRGRGSPGTSPRRPWRRPSRCQASLAMRLFGSLMASPTIGPLTRFSTGPSIMPLERSHSQALSRGGLPNSSRNPPGSSTLRVEQLRRPRARRQAGQAARRAGRPVDGVVQHLGRQPAGQGVRVVDLVVLVPAVRRDRVLVGPRLADRLDHVPRRRSRS